MNALLLLYVIGGVLLVILAIPMIRGRVRPNVVYGFRVAQTLQDPDTWYAVNAHFGRRLLVTGVATVLAALVFYLLPGMDVDSYAWAVLAVFVLFFGVGLAQSWRYMQTLTGKRRP